MEVFPSLHSIFINYNSNLLAPVASFAKMVETGLLAVCAQQHAPKTQGGIDYENIIVTLLLLVWLTFIYISLYLTLWL